MMKRVAFVLGFVVLACAFSAAVLYAEEATGKVKSVDAEKKTITITTKKDDKEEDKTFTIDDMTKIVAKKGKKGEAEDVKDGLKNDKVFGKNPEVTVTYETKDGKDTVSKIMVKGGGGKKEKDKGKTGDK